jgi:hypothetical protein
MCFPVEIAAVYNCSATSLLERLSQFLADRNLNAANEVQLPIENWQEFLD